MRPMTTQEIDDGWQLDEILPVRDDEPYLELTVTENRTPASGFEEAFWEGHEKKRLASRFGTTPKDFGKRRGVRLARMRAS